MGPATPRDGTANGADTGIGPATPPSMYRDGGQGVHDAVIGVATPPLAFRVHDASSIVNGVSGSSDIDITLGIGTYFPNLDA